MGRGRFWNRGFPPLPSLDFALLFSLSLWLCNSFVGSTKVPSQGQVFPSAPPSPFFPVPKEDLDSNLEEGGGEGVQLQGELMTIGDLDKDRRSNSMRQVGHPRLNDRT